MSSSGPISTVPKLNRVAAASPTGHALFGMWDSYLLLLASSDASASASASEELAELQQQRDAAWAQWTSSFQPQHDRSLHGIPCGADKQLVAAYRHLDDHGWTSQSAKDRTAAAEAALALSADCAEAYLLLAESTATTFAAAKDLYDRGVAAGLRHVEKVERNFIAVHTQSGRMWDASTAAQPLMRCKLALANTLRELGNFDEAVRHLHELMLWSAPTDHLGARTSLIATLLRAKMYEPLTQLIPMLYAANAPGVVPAFLFWTDVLLTFRACADPAFVDSDEHPDLRAICLGQALSLVPRVYPYLLGEKALPFVKTHSGQSTQGNEQRDDKSRGMVFVGPFVVTGEESEAQVFVRDCGSAFAAVPGLVDWLVEQRRVHGAGINPAYGKDKERSARIRQSANNAFREGTREKLQTAIHMYTTATKFLPETEDCRKDRAVLLCNIAATYYQLEMYQQSLAFANTAARFDSENWKAHFRAAQAMLRLGNRAEARKVAERALELDPGNSTINLFIKDCA
eukprot:ANDGO_05531.mRNA.1 Protein ST7 homolog